MPSHFACRIKQPFVFWLSAHFRIAIIPEFKWLVLPLHHRRAVNISLNNSSNIFGISQHLIFHFKNKVRCDFRSLTNLSLLTKSSIVQPSVSISDSFSCAVGMFGISSRNLDLLVIRDLIAVCPYANGGPRCVTMERAVPCHL